MVPGGIRGVGGRRRLTMGDGYKQKRREKIPPNYARRILERRWETGTVRSA